MGIADHSPSPAPSPELPSRPASELVTPDMYGRACVGVLSDLWLYIMDVETGSLRNAGMLGTAVHERGGGM